MGTGGEQEAAGVAAATSATAAVAGASGEAAQLRDWS